jgi:hypothetical protein
MSAKPSGRTPTAATSASSARPASTSCSSTSSSTRNTPQTTDRTVAAIVATHGRSKTAELLAGVETIPPKYPQYLTVEIDLAAPQLDAIQ